jgi:uncharacterized RDD family membrane protein YckC
LAEPRIHPSGAEYASWWSRVGAQIIDSLVLVIPTVVVAAIVASVVDGSFWIYTILFIAMTAVYDGLLDGGPTGQTLGKRVVKIKVIDERTAGTIGVGRGVGRSLFQSALGLPSQVIPLLQLLPLVDVLWPLWDQQRQGWHDKAVGSVVVRLGDEV